MTQEQIALAKLDLELKELTSTPHGRRAFLATSSLLLAACATGPQHREREGNLIGNETDITVPEEQQMTREVLPKMQKDYPAIQNAEVQNYVKKIGSRIVRANGLEGNPYNYNFTAVDVPYVNAFALPAGTVFVTAPLIAMADSEAEFAGVVGHEVGHIKARHTAQRITKEKRESGNTAWLAAGGALLGGALGYGASKILCKPKDKACLQRSIGYGLAAGAAGGFLVQKYKFMANSREDEMEADRIGFRTCVAANYDKDQSGLFYSKLLKMEQQSKGQADPLSQSLSDALSTHPPSIERVNQMQSLAQATANNPKAITSTAEFDRVRKICQQITKRSQERAKAQTNS